MDKLNSLLKQRFAPKSAFSKRVEASMIVEYANQELKKIFGVKGFALLKAVSLRLKILTIYCQNPIIAQELVFKQNSLVRGLNDHFGLGTINRIRTVLRSLDKSDEL